MCNARYIHHAVNEGCTDVICHPDTDFCSSLPMVQANKIDNVCSTIVRTIHSTGTDPAIALPHNDQGSFDENFLDYGPEELIEQPNNSVHDLSGFVATTDAIMRFSAVLTMGGSAIASSSQPVLFSDSNSNSNNITSIENTGLVDGSTIVDSAMSLGSLECCQ